MLETDAPYFGFKGCRNTEQTGQKDKLPNVPASMPLVAAAVAECLLDLSGRAGAAHHLQRPQGFPHQQMTTRAFAGASRQRRRLNWFKFSYTVSCSHPMLAEYDKRTHSAKALHSACTVHAP